MRFSAQPLVLLLCIWSLAGTGDARTDNVLARSAPTLESRVDHYLTPYVKIRGFSGAVLVAQHGRILVRKGYGMANYELGVPNTPRHRFHLGSISKTFTAAAIMILQQQGELSVRDPISRYVHDFGNGDRITIHHLLTNTSGIPNINNFPEYSNLSRFPHTTEDLVARFNGKRLDFEPGTRGYTESNSNYNLLAYIVEKLSGMAYGQFVKEKILDPLGMGETGHDGDARALLPERASGYAPAGSTDLENAPYLDWSTKIGNGSMYSTIDDLYRWDRALYGSSVLDSAAVGTIFEQQYGWFSAKKGARTVIRMNGLSPGFNADVERFPADDACIIVLSNIYIANASIIADDIAKMIFTNEDVNPAIGPAVAVARATLDQFVGTYRFGDDFFTPGAIYRVQRKDDELLVGRDGADTAVVGQSPTRFFHRPFWSTLEFRKANGGGYDLVWLHGSTAYVGKRIDSNAVSRTPSK